MIIDKLILEDYIPLTIISHINRLEMDFFENSIMPILGKNGCLVGDTEIDVPRDMTDNTDGYKLKDLVGKEFLTYCYNIKEKKLELKKAKNVRKTGEKREVWKVKYKGVNYKGFKNYDSIIGTPCHRMLLSDGTYKPLGELKKGDRLYSLYRKRNGQYIKIWDTNNTPYHEHKLITESLYGYSEITHHKNKKKYDNSVINLAPMTSTEHKSLHAKERKFYGRLLWEKVGHPRGHLSKPHTKAAKRRISDSIKAVCDRKRTILANSIYTKDKLYKKYILENKTLPQIAEELGTYYHNIHKYLKYHQIPLRHHNHVVESVEFYGYEDVYDMEVEDNHNFVANGVLVHNSGKSATLKELSPLPAISTSYSKTGSKEIHITHNYSKYICISDFGNKQHTHSFIKDTIELNTSGKANIQVDLCKQHLGYDIFLDKLTSNRFKISNLSKSERKDLFLKLYPSDLSFLSTYYKKICSMIRDKKSNIKMLEGRKNLINDKLIEKSHLKELYILKASLDDFNNVIDKISFILDHENTDYDNKKQKCNIHSFDDIINKCNSIDDNILDVRKKANHIFNVKDYNVYKGMLINNKKNEIARVTHTEEELIELKEALEKLEEYKDTNSEQLILELSEKIKVSKDALLELNYDEKLPIISKTKIEEVKSNIYPNLKNNLNHIHSLGIKIYRKGTIKKIKDKILEYDMILNDLSSNKTIYKNHLKVVLKKTENAKKYTYPDHCKETCGIKSYIEKLKETNRKELEGLKEKISEIDKNSSTYTFKSERLKKLCEYDSTIGPIIANIENTIRWNHWGKYLLNEFDLNTLLNKDIFQLSNNLNKLIITSEKYHKANEVKEDLTLHEYKLKILKEAQLPAQQIISKTIIEKQALVIKKNIEYETLNNTINKLSTDISGVDKLLSSVKDYDELQKVFITYSNNSLIDKHIEFNNMVLKELEGYKNITSNKLREIESTITEQENLQIRLNDELNPSLKIVRAQLKKYVNVERALSPKVGMPQKYIIKLINSLITIVNGYLQDIVSYPMELIHIDESKSLDFSLKVRFDTHAISDISVGSSAQKHMIDNAFTIAAYIYANYHEEYVLKLDEIDAYLEMAHEVRTIEFLAKITRQCNIKQLFLVSQHQILLTAFQHCNIFCLSDTENMSISEDTNKYIKIN